MTTITIPKSITGREELIVIPRKEFEELFTKKKRQAEENILNLSKEAKRLKKKGELPVLRSLRAFR